MNLIPELWQRSLVSVGLGITVIAILAFILGRFARSAAWRRLVWQIAFLVFGLVTASELVGVGALIPGARKTASNIASSTATEASRISGSDQRTVSVTVGEDMIQPLATTVPAAREQGWTLWWPGVVWVLIGGSLLGWAGARRLWAKRQLRPSRPLRSEPVKRRMRDMACRLGLARWPRLIEVDGLASPVAFGVFRPTIGLPVRFEKEFPQSQQDAALAHELAHLQANDPAWQAFADVVTALLWWHPLVWWARRELRQTSELAADEASLLLENGPQALAECLVSLGRQMIDGPVTNGLGIGGRGYRSGLGQRVERLLKLGGRTWRPLGRLPRRLARAFGAVLLALLVGLSTGWMHPPAANSWKQNWDQSLAGVAWAALLEPAQDRPSATSNRNDESASSASSASIGFGRSNEVGRLLRDGKSLYEAGKLEEAKVKLQRALEMAPTNRAVQYYLELAQEKSARNAGEQPGMFANSRQRLLKRLNQIVLEEVTADRVTLGEFLKDLSDQARKKDHEGLGINFVFSAIADTNGRGANTADNITVTIKPPLKAVKLEQALEAMVKSASVPLKFSVESHAVVVSPATRETLPVLYTRTYKVDPETLFEQLQKSGVPGLKTNSPRDMILKFFATSGVSLAPPKQCFFNDRLGLLLVRATLADLDAIELALQSLNISPPQVLIEVKLVELAETAYLAAKLDQLFEQRSATRSGRLQSFEASAVDGLRQRGFTNPPQPKLAAVLTDSQFRETLRQLERQSGVDLLAAPKIATLLGRQAQVRVGETKFVVTGWQANTNGPSVTNSSGISPVSEPFELGPCVDIVPDVSADGLHLQLNVVCSIREFFGYDTNRKETVLVEVPGAAPVAALKPNPIIRDRKLAASTWLRDQETIVLAGEPITDAPQPGENASTPAQPVRKHWLVFVTPVMIDPAGNPLNPPSAEPILRMPRPARR